MLETPPPTRFSVSTHEFPFVDPYASEAASRIREGVSEAADRAAAFYGAVSGHQRKRLSTPDLDNPGTQWLMDQIPSFQHWLSQVPTAAALHPLYNPEVETYTSGVPVCDEIRHWFRNLADARGIRSRAAVMQRVLTAEALDRPGPHDWLSLACGAAQPVFSTIEEIAAAGGSTPSVTLADLDSAALALARTYAADHHIDRTSIRRLNVLDRRGFERLPGRVPGIRNQSGWTDRFDMVDAVGLLEYLKPDDWVYAYNGVIRTRRKMAGAITFLRNAFATVRPGGLLLVGNMLDTHPELSFTMDVIQWPHIQPRSIAEMTDLFSAAGLTGHVEVHLPSDGVYALYAIRKAPA